VTITGFLPDIGKKALGVILDLIDKNITKCHLLLLKHHGIII
jgi:hypothetical protein